MSLNAVTDANFEAEVLQSPQPVLVDFWAEWCTACKPLSAVLDGFAAQYDQIKFAACDFDANTATGSRYDIATLPTLILFQDGVVQAKLAGQINKAQVRKLLDEAI